MSLECTPRSGIAGSYGNCSSFGGTARLFSKTAVPFHSLTCSAGVTISVYNYLSGEGILIYINTFSKNAAELKGDCIMLCLRLCQEFFPFRKNTTTDNHTIG
jgi:hypothetical protein